MTIEKKISLWLYISAAAVFLMAIIGAVTRLTESGLSIVEWKPVTGALPPLDAAAWQAEFDLYRQSPQYLKVNHGMSLEEFKQIFFWEWLHRLWGRLIGVIYAVPLLFFWRHLPRDSRAPALGILALGLAQGAMGWYMVKSGLVDQPAVSHYRLAAHLMLAFLIYGCLLRFALSFSHVRAAGAERLSSLRGFVWATIVAASLTMTWGAFTAGLDAGLLYNTFPTMDGHWLPPELGAIGPLWRDFLDEPAVVQFVHRVLAILTLAMTATLVLGARKMSPPPALRQAMRLLGGVAVLQVSLGIATLLSGVNIVLATLHQAGALLLISVLVWLLAALPGKEKA